MIMHIHVDKKQAWEDAQQLANGEFYEDPEEQDPFIQEVATHPEDGEEDIATLRIIMGGEFTVAEVPPIDNQVNWDYAEAIKRAGYHIMGLLQENEMLLAAQGKDVAEQRIKLLVALKKLRADYRKTIYHLIQGLPPSMLADWEKRREVAFKDVDAVIAECTTKEPGHATS